MLEDTIYILKYYDLNPTITYAKVGNMHLLLYKGLRNKMFTVLWNGNTGHNWEPAHTQSRPLLEDLMVSFNAS